MNKDITPEEKLLNVIRKKPKPRAQEGAPGKTNKGDLYISRWKSALQQPVLAQSIGREEINVNTFKGAQKILLATVIAACLYIVFILIAPSNPQEVESKYPDDVASAGEASPIAVVEPLPYSYYSQQLGTRDIFKSHFLSDDTDLYSKDNLDKLLKSIKLVGIMLDEVPQVIIEDTKEKKTYFLSEGETLNQFRVEEILEGKVVLSFEGEEIELVP
ncbi:hypothetical protein ACFL38_01170 [Candidatus Omnitrophota bacterium]